MPASTSTTQRAFISHWTATALMKCINLISSSANVADCKIAEKLAECVEDTVFADAGYLQKDDSLKRVEEKGVKFEAAPRKNMKRLMSRFECCHIKHRSIIESDWGTLKNNFQLEYHKARSITGMFRHFFTALLLA